MASLIAIRDLTIRDSPSFAGLCIGKLPMDAKVDGLPTAEPNWFQVTGGGPAGFVPFTYLRAENPPPPPMDDADRDAFCDVVTTAARDHEVELEYLMALAFAESDGINNDQAADSDAFGPFRLLPATWNALVATQGAAYGITNDMLFQWWQQPTFAAILTKANTAALASALDRPAHRPELYFAHRFGLDAARRLLLPGALAADFANALQAFPGRVAGTIATDGNGARRSVAQVVEALDERLRTGLDGATPFIDRQNPLRAGAAQPSATLNVKSLTVGQQPMAQRIIDAFAAGGFGKLQQACAVANADAESSLDPLKRGPKPPTVKEDSVGLFQLNRQGGLGTGCSVADLQDPNFNIDRVIKQLNRTARSFAAATTIEEAVRIFVEELERPADSKEAIGKRLPMAKNLLA